MQAIIVSASSDIGTAIALRWLAKGWSIVGTYRTIGPQLAMLKGIDLIHCDVSDTTSIRKACVQLHKVCWDILVMAPGALEPIGAFQDCDFSEWVHSVNTNFIGQMRLVHGLLPHRNKNACVLFFAGGGVNSATLNYSAYTVSKIALIKMCELLDAEVPDTRFVIVGPGWVKTKIHAPSLRAGKSLSDNCTPMQAVLDSIDWLVALPKEVVGGRNFSVAHDKWGSQELEDQLSQRPDMYKLRRNGNDWQPDTQ